SLNRHTNYRAKVETVADAPASIVDTRMAHCVGINPAGAGFTYDLRHSIEHARSRLDVHTRITEKENIGIGSIEDSLNTCGRVVVWIDDVHTPPRRVILATNCNASRHPLRAHDNDASHPICLEKLAQFLFHDKALAARRVTHENFFAIAHDDSSMKHIEILACRRKKNQVTALQISLEPWQSRLRYTFHANPLCSESRYNIQNAFPVEYRDSRH